MSTLSYFSSFGIGNFVSMGTRASVNRIVISIGFFFFFFFFVVVYFITMASIDIIQVDVFQGGKSLSNSKIDKTGLCTSKRIQTIHMTIWYTHQNHT